MIERPVPTPRSEETIHLTHFRFNPGREGNLPGVEQVMATHKELLEDKNVPIKLIVGETNVPENERARSNIEVYPPLRMDEENLGVNGAKLHLAPSPEDIARGIPQDWKAALHNSVLGWRYNDPYGRAAAMMVDQSVQGVRALSVLWVHDPVGDPVHLHPMLPREDGARIAVISRVREQTLRRSFDDMVRLGLSVPKELDIRVIPNSLSPAYFQEAMAIPESLSNLAPNFTAFTRQERLPQTEGEAEALLSSHIDAIKLLLVGRPAHNKGVIEAIRMADALTAAANHEVALFVTNIPDYDMVANKQYWEYVKEMLGTIRNVRLRVLFLGGIKNEYMKWLYAQSDLVIAPFINEGFGLPPVEAAMVNTPSVISDDPALMETTAGHAPVIEIDKWRREPTTVAVEVFNYLNTEKALENVAAKQQHSQANYSPAATIYHVSNILDIAA